ncbi:MAG: pseudomurein-binding repeat-containing protein [Methanothermobacter sp.]|nr:pseudomurein-binding repeat-containing protein [Methanothermobacter tenebrarum]MDX9693773.1 pseudomurein-binding repeat-containing protein [Methanothermobacter sp.]
MKRLLLPTIMFFILMSSVHGADLSYNEISVASKLIENYGSSNGKIPNGIVLNNKSITLDDYLYAATTTTIKLNNNQKTSVTTNNYKPPISSLNSTATGTLTRTEYLQVAQNIKKYMETYQRSPNYATTTIGKVNYQSLIYAYARIINFYNENQRLPTSITVRRLTSSGTSPENTTNNSVVIGRTTYGLVVREGPYGNSTSPDKVVFIVGVHPLESQSHNAIIEAIRALNGSLNKCYYIYRVNVTKDASDYEKGRINGELLANQYVVPEVKRMLPRLVIDAHSNRGTYPAKRFLFVPYNSTEAKRIANMIKDKASWLTIYNPPTSTSATYVTIPLIKAGIPSIIYETYAYDPYAQILQHATQIVSIIDNLLF